MKNKIISKQFKLDNWRKRIDVIDSRIVKLLMERFTLSIAIGNWKRKAKKPLIDKVREAQVLNRVEEYAPEILKKQVKKVFRTIIVTSRNLQKRKDRINS